MIKQYAQNEALSRNLSLRKCCYLVVVFELCLLYVHVSNITIDRSIHSFISLNFISKFDT